MFQFFVNQENIHGEYVIIEGNDVNHIRNALRMKPGEQIRVSAQGDLEYICEIASFGEGCVKATILDVEKEGAELPSKIYLFQGLPKKDKMELVIQKAVELGVYEIIPVAMKRSVAKLDPKKEEQRLKRWAGIAQSAAKQSGRRVIPGIQRVMTFAEAVEYGTRLDCKLLPYEKAEGMEQTGQRIESIQAGSSIGVFIGPEGGFSQEEYDLAVGRGFVPITLGRRILRTETAGMALLAILGFHLERQYDREWTGHAGLSE